MKVPTIIYLQRSDDDWWGPDIDCTWTTKRLSNDDIEYIVIDEYNDIAAENLRLRNELEQWRMAAIANGSRYGR